MVCRTLLETTGIIGFMVPMGYIYIIMSGHVAPFKRGFFCDDESIKHPWTKHDDETVTHKFITLIAIK